MNVRKFLKWIVDPDLLKQYLIPANAFFDRGPDKKPSNICLRGDTFRQRLHAPSLRVFSPDRVNVNRRERNSAIGIKRNRYHIIAVSLGEHPRFLDRRASCFFNRCDHRIIRTFRQRNSQRHIALIALMAQSFRPRTAGGCVGHTGATSSCIPLTGAGVNDSNILQHSSIQNLASLPHLSGHTDQI